MGAQGLPREERTLSALAASCAALVFVVVAASAWLRLAAVACPAGGCDGFTLADAVRLAHRVAAMGVSVLALVIAALAWKAPARPARRVASVAILVLVAVLAIVGRSSAGSPPPAVVLANLLGGLALLAAATGLAVAVRAPRGRLPGAFAAALALVVLAAATGGLLSAAPGESSPLGMVHRALAWASLAGWGLLAMSAAPAPGARWAARLAAALLVAQVVVALALPGWPLARWLHNLLTSAALCAALASALASRSAPREVSPLPDRATVRT